MSLFLLPVSDRCGFRTGVPSSASRSAQPTPKPTALVATQTPATALEGRRVERRGLHQMMMSPRNPPAAPHLTARPPCPALPMETWVALPAWAPAQPLLTAVTQTTPAPPFSRVWSLPAGPVWDRPTRPWPSPLPRLRRFWRPGSQRTVWPGPLLESCPPSTENPILPSRQTCSEAQWKRRNKLEQSRVSSLVESPDLPIVRLNWLEESAVAQQGSPSPVKAHITKSQLATVNTITEPTGTWEVSSFVWLSSQSEFFTQFDEEIPLSQMPLKDILYLITLNYTSPQTCNLNRTDLTRRHPVFTQNLVSCTFSVFVAHWRFPHSLHGSTTDEHGGQVQR